MIGKPEPGKPATGGFLAWLGSSAWGPYLLVPVAALALYAGPGWAGIHTPDFTLVPQAYALLAYGVFFTYGWALATGERAGLTRLAQNWPRYLLPGLVGCALALFVQPEYYPGASEGLVTGLRIAYALSYALGMAGMATGFIGLFLRMPNKESPLARYLADASYWLYLAHLPLVMGLQVAMARLPWHWSAKFSAIMAVSLGLLLVSYHFLIRPTAIGALLNGRRYPIGRQRAGA